MSRKKLLFLVLLVLSIGISLIIQFGKFQKTENNNTCIQDFFITTPIQDFTSQLPIIEVEIEGQNIPVILDLGFTGNLELFPATLSRIKKKKYKETVETTNFTGARFQKKSFSIPKLSINGLAFKNPTVLEALHEEEADLRFSSKDKPSTNIKGSVGWQTFEKANLLIDCKNNIVAFFSDIKKLDEFGYPLSIFTETDLIVENSLLRIKAITDKGSIQCCLDTGASWNTFNGPVKEGLSLTEWILSDENRYYIEQFKIGNKDFANQPFCTIPIKLPTYVQAILGMQFFEDNVVALDFKNKKAYFLPNEELP